MPMSLTTCRLTGPYASGAQMTIEMVAKKVST